MRMEAWRQWPLGGRKTFVSQETQRIYLAQTGLLWKCHNTQNPTTGVLSEMEILRQLPFWTISPILRRCAVSGLFGSSSAVVEVKAESEK